MAEKRTHSMAGYYFYSDIEKIEKSKKQKHKTVSRMEDRMLKKIKQLIESYRDVVRTMWEEAGTAVETFAWRSTLILAALGLPLALILITAILAWQVR